MKILLLDNHKIAATHKHNLELFGYDFDICTGNEYFRDYDLVIVCTPEEQHLNDVHFMNDNGVRYVMLEKPLCTLPTIFQQMPVEYRYIKPLTSQVFVNHAYKFERGIRELKRQMNKVGKVKSVSIENINSYNELHPDLPYEQFKGLIYDDQFIINTSRFLFGEPTEYLCKNISKDYLRFDWFTDKGIRVSHTSDLSTSMYKKRIEVRGDKGTLIYNYGSHELWYCEDNSPRIPLGFHFCDHQAEALRYVLDVVESGKEFEINTIEDSVKDMSIIEELSK
jgi:predicted dehydrogenase